MRRLRHLTGLVLVLLGACATTSGLPEHPWGKTDRFVVFDRLTVVAPNGQNGATDAHVDLAINPARNMFNIYYKDVLYDFTLALSEKSSRTDVSDPSAYSAEVSGLMDYESALQKYLDLPADSAAGAAIVQMPFLIAYKYNDSSQPVRAAVTLRFYKVLMKDGTPGLELSFGEVKSTTTAGKGYLPGMKMFPWVLSRATIKQFLHDISLDSIDQEAMKVDASGAK